MVGVVEDATVVGIPARTSERENLHEESRENR